MPLHLRDRELQIACATLTATLPDPHWLAKYHPGGGDGLVWALEIKTFPREFDGELWSPSIGHDHLLFPVRDWREIAGRSVEWTEPWDEETGEANGSLYVFGHEDISEGALRFGERQDAAFPITWTGKADILWNEEWGSAVPFTLEALALFTGVRVNGSASDTDATLRQRLAAHLDLDQLVQEPIEYSQNTYEDGVHMAHALFTPRA